MDYYRSEVTVSPIEPLLDQLDAAEAEPDSKDLVIPSIEQFLDEEGKSYCIFSMDLFCPLRARL